MILKAANIILPSTVLLAAVGGVVVWFGRTEVAPTPVVSGAMRPVAVTTKLESVAKPLSSPLHVAEISVAADELRSLTQNESSTGFVGRPTISPEGNSRHIQIVEENVHLPSLEFPRLNPAPASEHEPAVLRRERSIPIASVSAVFNIDPATPGASLQLGETSVLVEAYQQLPQESAPALAIAITDIPKPEAPAQTQPETPSQANSLPNSKQIGTMSYEEQLFRMKWGWAAYEATRKAALEPTPATN